MKYIPLVVALLYALPLAVFAQDPGGLVNCSGPDCNFCSLVDLTKILIDWLFGFLVLAAVLVLMIAGFKLVVSAGNPSAMSDAKKMATNVIVGFVIVMAAFIIVDTLIKALVKPDSAFESWNEIQGAECGGIGTTDYSQSGYSSDDSTLYCYASEAGNITNLRGLDACNEARSVAESEGQNPGACYVCGS